MYRLAVAVSAFCAVLLKHCVLSVAAGKGAAAAAAAAATGRASASAAAAPAPSPASAPAAGGRSSGGRTKVSHFLPWPWCGDAVIEQGISSQGLARAPTWGAGHQPPSSLL